MKTLALIASALVTCSAFAVGSECPVTSVAGRTGNVLLNVTDIAGLSPLAVHEGPITSAQLNPNQIGVNQIVITDSVTGETLTYANCALGEVLIATRTGWTCSDLPARIQALEAKLRRAGIN